MAEEPRTLEEIGTRFHISRERVRQIEQRILKKARASFNGDLVKLNVWRPSGKPERDENYHKFNERTR
jgi:RNA polymerase sigma-32 factor